MDTIFSVALQCQVKDAFSATQDKSEPMKVQALITVFAGEWSSMLNILSLGSVISRPIFFSVFPIVKLCDFVLLNYSATTFFNLATVFCLKVTKWWLGIFFNFMPYILNYTSKTMMQWGSYCLQWSLGPGWSVWRTCNSFSALLQWLFLHFCASNLHDKTTMCPCN